MALSPLVLHLGMPVKWGPDCIPAPKGQTRAGRKLMGLCSSCIIFYALLWDSSHSQTQQSGSNYKIEPSWGVVGPWSPVPFFIHCCLYCTPHSKLLP